MVKVLVYDLGKVLLRGVISGLIFSISIKKKVELTLIVEKNIFLNF